MLWFVRSKYASTIDGNLLFLPAINCVQGRPRPRSATYATFETARSSSVLLSHDTGLRLADKRSLPCPHRNEWITTRDGLYEQIMQMAWNKDLQIFGQSYEETHVLDSSVMIMPLVFFMNPSDPRFLSTLRAVLKSPERGGLTSNVSSLQNPAQPEWLTVHPFQGLVYRYDVNKADDGVGGEEGTFCLCTLWCVSQLFSTQLITSPSPDTPLTGPSKR